ncbi:hypothetical protein RUND412_004425 [Rhizina undulata]
MSPVESDTNVAPSQNPAPPVPAPSAQELISQQKQYADLRYKFALGMLFVAPALMLVPPRKIDVYTFGLGTAWVYCLSEVSSSHGKDIWRAFKRTPDHSLHGASAGTATGPGYPNEKTVDASWRGEKIAREYREKENEGKSISDLIMEQIWDVWEQRDAEKEKGLADAMTREKKE